MPSLLLYGLATIIGAGIYVLVSPAVSKAGMTAPLVFLVAECLFSAVAVGQALEWGDRRKTALVG
jgi:hypothetical protein